MYRFIQGDNNGTEAWNGCNQGLEQQSDCSMHVPILHLHAKRMLKLSNLAPTYIEPNQHILESAKERKSF